MALPKKDKTYKTLEEAQTHCGPKETVFHVVDHDVPERNVYVVAKSHPLARAAAALTWGFTCATAGTRRRITPYTVSQAAVNMSPAEREALARVLLELNKSAGILAVASEPSGNGHDPDVLPVPEPDSADSDKKVKKSSSRRKK